MAVLAGCMPANAAADPADAAATEVLVRFRSDTASAERAAVRRDAGTAFEQALPVPGLQLVDPGPGVSIREAVQRLERSDDVLYAEPDVTRSAAARATDPYFSSQWALDMIGMPAAWSRSTGSSTVTVGVVDSGMDRSHPDLSPNVARNDGESGGGRETNGRDDDANGLVDDWRGWDWAEGDNDPADVSGHGTHVAGILGARGNDFTGMAGVGWQVKLMPLRVLDATNTGRVSDIVAAYGYAASKKLPIVNASLGGPTFSQAEHDAIKAASGTLFVVAAGNDGRNNDVTGTYPCNHPLPNIVCVTASDQNDGLPGFASYGSRSVDLAAPGVDILSALPGARWGTMSGTSSATPHVAGTAALIRSLWPEASVATMRAALLANTDGKPSFDGKTLTGGRLNADRALSASTGDDDFPAEVGIDPARAPAAAPPAPPAPPPPVTAHDETPPALATRFVSTRRLRVVLRRGLRVGTTCSEACSLRLRLTVARASVAQLELAAPTVVLGHGRGRLGAPGSRVIRVTLSARGRRLLERLGSRVLTLAVQATDPAGNRSTVRRALRVRG